jgi:hypothetical protein
MAGASGILCRGRFPPRRGLAVNVKEVRRLALALPQVSEEPHFHLSSFRVHGKIFATLAPDGSFLNVFVGDEQRELMVAVEPKAYEALWWGKKVVGLHVHMAAAKSRHVEQLLRSAWERKAPKKLVKS